MGDAVLSDQLRRGLALKLRKAYDVRTAGDRSHRRSIAEGTAKRDCAEQRCIWRIQPNVARHIGGVSSDGLLIVQNEFRSAGRARGGESEARHIASRLIRSSIGSRAIQRQYRQSGKLSNFETDRQSQHTANRSAILRRQRRKNRREIDRLEAPLRHHSGGARPAQQIANFRRAKPRVDVNGKRPEPSAGENSGEIIDAIRQPQCDPDSRPHFSSTQRSRHSQHAIPKLAPVHRAAGVGHRWSLRIAKRAFQQRAQRTRIFWRVAFPHPASISAQLTTIIACLNCTGSEV